MPEEKLPITALVLTRNEGRNLRACLESISPYVTEIVVIDSDSKDDTLAISAEFGCRVVQFAAATQATIYEWVLKEVRVNTPWTMRVDADERWPSESLTALGELIKKDDGDGFYVSRKTYFMGRWIKHGGFYPIRLILVWRTGKARVENRLMDEHFIIDGVTRQTDIDVIEANYDRQQNLGLWTTKHNTYSDRYAAEYMLKKYGLMAIETISADRSVSTSRKAWAKENVYDRAPLFWRALGYYLYRYIGQLGFLDGGRGFIYHFLQAFWFRFLIDAKIVQLEREIAGDPAQVRPYLREHLGIDVRDGRVFLIPR
jgi:glycosyltransferase involved in cell wall biosynthesis